MGTLWRRTISKIMSVIMVLSCFAGMTFSVGAETSGDYEYEVLDDGTVSITKYNGSDSDVTIPTEIDGAEVTQLGNTVNSIFSTSSVSVKNVKISDGIKTIQKKAFYNCTSLESVLLSDTIELIDAEAFLNCESLKSINLPASLQKIEQAFDGCKQLKLISVDRDSKFFSSIDGVLYNKDKTSIVCYPEGKEAEFFSVPETVEIFASGFGLKNNNYLKRVYFPAKIKYENYVDSYTGYIKTDEGFTKNGEFTICSYVGSGAEKYAYENGFNFIDSALCTHGEKSLFDDEDYVSEINVLDFGAVGDGITDDSGSIQNALDYARENSVNKIYFPKKTYLIKTCLYYYSDSILEFEKGAVLKRGSKELRYLLSNDADESTKLYDGTSNVIITGVVFDGNVDYVTNESNDNKCTLLTTVHANNIIVKNCTFKNGNVWHLYEICASKNVKVINCFFNGTSYGGTAKQQDKYTELLQLDLDIVTTLKNGSKSYSCGSTKNGTSGDKTGCDKIDIVNCNFYTNGTCNAIGNHNPLGEKHIEIKIEECVFRGGGNTGGYLDFDGTTENVKIYSNTFFNKKDDYVVCFAAKNAESYFYNNRCFDYETLINGFGVMSYNNTLNGCLICPDEICFKNEFLPDVYCSNCCKLIENGTKINQQHEYVDGKCTVCGKADPNYKPIEKPTAKPTEAPTEKPTEVPTEKPTEIPAEKPSETTTEPTTKAEEKLEFADSSNVNGKIDEENKKVSIVPSTSAGMSFDDFKAMFKGAVSAAGEKIEEVFNGMKFTFNGNEYTFILKGDTSPDGKITAKDARSILRIAARLDSPDEVTKDAADVDSDGKVTGKEARSVLRFAAKLQNKIYE